MTNEAVAEVIRQCVPVSANDVALRFLERDVADRCQRAGALVVDHLIGCQDIVVVENLDVAARDNAITSGVIDQLIALQVHRLRMIEVGIDLAEQPAGWIDERICGRARTRARTVDFGAWVLRRSGRCSEQKCRK